MVARLRLRVVASLRLYRVTSPIRRIARLVLRFSFRNRCRRLRSGAVIFRIWHPIRNFDKSDPLCPSFPYDLPNCLNFVHDFLPCFGPRIFLTIVAIDAWTHSLCSVQNGIFPNFLITNLDNPAQYALFPDDVSTRHTLG